MVWVIAFGELFFGDLWCVVWGYGGMRTHFSLLNPHIPTPSAPLTKSKKHQLQPELVFRIATLTGLEPATSAVTGRRANQLRHRAIMIFSGTPNGIRTRVAAVKGRSPRPLDDGSPT